MTNRLKYEPIEQTQAADKPTTPEDHIYELRGQLALANEVVRGLLEYNDHLKRQIAALSGDRVEGCQCSCGGGCDD